MPISSFSNPGLQCKGYTRRHTILRMLWQPAKARSPIEAMLFGIEINSRFEHPWNDSFCMFVKPFGNSIRRSDLQPLKAREPTVTTVFGIFISAKFEHAENALLPISSRLPGKLALTRLEQPSKVPLHIFFTPSGMSTPVIAVQPAKALLSISVTFSGMCTMPFVLRVHFIS